jgi:hypothetical protein
MQTVLVIILTILEYLYALLRFKSQSQSKIVGVWNSAKRDKAHRVVFHSTTTKRGAHRTVPSPSMGPWEGNRSWGRRMEKGGEEMERQEGMQVPRW